MRSGPYKSGKRAEAFLSQRLAERAVVPVDRLLAEAEQENIDPMTLRRAAERLGVAKLVCWALPDKQATVKGEEPVAPVEAQGPAVAAVVETDPRVEQAAAEVSRLIAEGMGREIAIHRACRGNRELEARLLKERSR